MEKKDLSRFLESFLDYLVQKSVQETKSSSPETVQAIQENVEKIIENPDYFYLKTTGKVKNVFMAAGFPLEAANVIVNFWFYKEHLAKVISLKEGTTCCVDKATYVIRKYLRYLCFNEAFHVPKPGKDEYWIPGFWNEEESEKWIKLFNRLTNLLCGNVTSFLEFVLEEFHPALQNQKLHVQSP